MANRNPSTCGRIPQDNLGELSAVFSSLDDSALLVRLQEYRPTGRQGYPLKALWRAYVGSFVLNLAHIKCQHLFIRCLMHLIPY